MTEQEEKLNEKRKKVEETKEKLGKTGDEYKVETYATGENFDIISSSGKTTHAKVNDNNELSTFGEQAHEIKDKINNGKEMQSNNPNEKEHSNSKENTINLIKEAKHLSEEEKEKMINQVKELDVIKEPNALKNIEAKINSQENAEHSPQNEPEKQPNSQGKNKNKKTPLSPTFMAQHFAKGERLK